MQRTSLGQKDRIEQILFVACIEYDTLMYACIEYDTLKCLVSLSELGIEKKERKRGSLFLQE